MGFASDSQRTARVVTLDADGLDLLEQVLLGARTLRSLEDALGLERRPAGDVLLHDSENTPVARIRGGLITPLSPLAQGAGPQWDPVVRRRPDEIRDTSRAGGGPVVALVLHTPPTLAELDAARAAVAARGANTLILAALVSRSPASETGVPSPRVGPNGLVRAIKAIAAELSLNQQEMRIIPLAAPWPLRPSIPRSKREGEIRELLAAYGATIILIGEDQSELNEKEARKLLPAASRI